MKIKQTHKTHSCCTHKHAPNDVVHHHFADHHALRSAKAAERRVGGQVGAAHAAARSDAMMRRWM